MNIGYEKVFDELNNELTQLEAKPFYDLFKKLYCSNYSLRNEIEQVSRRYYKLHELVNNKSKCVERLYELLQILSKPEVKILSLLKEMEDGNTVPLEHVVVRIITNDEHAAIDDIYKEFDDMIRKIKNDKINPDALENLCIQKNNIYEHNETSDIKSEDKYWEILKQYYYKLGDRVFLSESSIIKSLKGQNLVSNKYSRGELEKDLMKIRDKYNYSKRR